MIGCSRLPPVWPGQKGHGQCGPLNIQAILRSRNIDVPVEELYVDAWRRKGDHCLPYDPAHVLTRRGVPAETRIMRPNALFAAAKELVRCETQEGGVGNAEYDIWQLCNAIAWPATFAIAPLT